MVVWTDKSTAHSSTGWLPLLVAFLIGVVATTALHRYVIYPATAQARKAPAKALPKPPRKTLR